jgi:Ni2+-binding GTPase involved in maturation of urease and hydrogenase/ABC-type lipoprotein export system ATPase subunit
VKVVTFSGPPSSGKTSVILKLIAHLRGELSIGVVKFDCLTSHDAGEYRSAGIEAVAGMSGAVCPDHYFASNVGACVAWGWRRGFDVLVSESAGLCNRCSPHLRDSTAVCVIDVLSGVDAPGKVGPMLRLADFVVITKGDLVSQAEREVFALRVVRANPRARVAFVNGLTGQGSRDLAAQLREDLSRRSGEVERLRFSMPGAVCSFCFGDTKVDPRYASGNIKYMDFPDQGGAPASRPPAPEPPSPPAAGAAACDGGGESYLLGAPFGRVARTHPACLGFFDQMRVPRPAPGQSFSAMVDGLDEFALSDCGMSAADLREAFVAYVARMEGVAEASASGARVGSVEILGGVNKDGRAESLDVTVRAGEVACIVGPTGSGKSRLLEDIEHLARGDTPTRRRVLVDGREPGDEERLSIENCLVAQLSQSMRFVMDLSARDFVRLHARSRMMQAAAVEPTVERVLSCANELAGEPFSPEASLTSLSGGQSRSLMIADLAFVSASPIVLVDEIENAGVDRRRALDLLVTSDKIVFVVTHDPLIALSGDVRLVVGNGAVRDVIRQDDRERECASRLAAIDDVVEGLRRSVRAGERLGERVERELTRLSHVCAPPEEGADTS